MTLASRKFKNDGFDDKDGFIWPSYVEDIKGPMLLTMVMVLSVGYERQTRRPSRY